MIKLERQTGWPMSRQLSVFYSDANVYYNLTSLKGSLAVNFYRTGFVN